MSFSNTGDLLQAQTHVWNHIFNFINSMSLKCAIQLGIPDIIYKHGKPMTPSQLVAALPNINPTKARCVHRLMRILVHFGFFAVQQQTTNKDGAEDEGFVLTNASEILLKDHPLTVTPFLMAMLDPILTDPWHSFGAWFENDDPNPFHTAHGRTFWDHAGHEPGLNHFFNEAMASDARLVSHVVMNDMKGVFEGLKSLVDVGGGTGTVSMAIAKAFPDMDCTVLDLPNVVNGLKSSDNLKFVEGDMFEAIPSSDAVLLKWIMHDWSDDDCVKILKKCKEAIKEREGGKVIVIDILIEENQTGDDESTETKLFFDMLMMVVLAGQERNEKQWAKLFFDAGFSHYQIRPNVLGLRSLIEVYP